MRIPAEEPSLSVLIVSWNQAERLAVCLEAVCRALPEAQIIVVDNGSEPPLALPEATSNRPLHLLRSEVNQGYAGGNNLGFAHCTGEYVLLLNNDAVLPSAEPVKTLVAFLERYPQVAAAQAKLVLPDGTLDTCGEGLTPWGHLYHHGYRRADGPHAAQAYPVFAAKGACMLLRRRAVANVGDLLFRPGFFCYYEDVDLCHRLWLAGHEVWFVPTTPVLHDEGASARLHPPRMIWRRYLTNMLTSAGDLWPWTAWVTRGLPFLGGIAVGAILRGVCPRIRRHHVVFQRTCPERLWRTRVTHRPTLRDVWQTIRRLLSR